MISTASKFRRTLSQSQKQPSQLTPVPDFQCTSYDGRSIESDDLPLIYHPYRSTGLLSEGTPASTLANVHLSYSYTQYSLSCHALPRAVYLPFNPPKEVRCNKWRVPTFTTEVRFVRFSCYAYQILSNTVYSTGNSPHIASIHPLTMTQFSTSFISIWRPSLMGTRMKMSVSHEGGNSVVNDDNLCQRWWDLILRSTSYLCLCPIYTFGTPAADMLAHSPPFSDPARIFRIPIPY